MCLIYSNLDMFLKYPFEFLQVFIPNKTLPEWNRLPSYMYVALAESLKSFKEASFTIY